MVVEAILGFVAWFIGLIGSAFPDWEPPVELTQISGMVADLMGRFGGLSAWVEWPVLTGCIAVSLATWAAVAGLKLIRAIAAHVPALGGSGD